MEADTIVQKQEASIPLVGGALIIIPPNLTPKDTNLYSCFTDTSVKMAKK